VSPLPFIWRILYTLPALCVRVTVLRWCGVGWACRHEVAAGAVHRRLVGPGQGEGQEIKEWQLGNRADGVQFDEESNGARFWSCGGAVQVRSVDCCGAREPHDHPVAR
jgi:hypothetical protein